MDRTGEPARGARPPKQSPRLRDPPRLRVKLGRRDAQLRSADPSTRFARSTEKGSESKGSESLDSDPFDSDPFLLLGPDNSVEAPELNMPEHRERDQHVVPLRVHADVGRHGDFADDRLVAAVREHVNAAVGPAGEQNGAVV